MRTKYGDALASEFWDPYFDEVKLWVTETSCSGDLKYDRVNKNTPNLPASPTAEQACMDLTGQECHHKDGSVAALLDMDNIERFSWFTLFPNPRPDHPNYESIIAGALVNATLKVPTEIGRAMLSGLDADAADCSTPMSPLPFPPPPAPPSPPASPTICFDEWDCADKDCDKLRRKGKTDTLTKCAKTCDYCDELGWITDVP